MFSQRNGRIIARLYDQSFHQVMHTDLLVDFNIHARPPHAPRLFADRNHVIHTQAARLELVVNNIRCHQLGNTGGLDLNIGLFFSKYAATIRINQNIILCRDLWCRRNRNSGVRCGDEQKKKRKNR